MFVSKVAFGLAIAASAPSAFGQTKHLKKEPEKLRRARKQKLIEWGNEIKGSYVFAKDSAAITSDTKSTTVPAGCNVPHPNWIGDGYCDSYGNYNTEACAWDGGDCCPSTCSNTAPYPCGSNAWDCVDPNGGDIGKDYPDNGSMSINNTPSNADLDDYFDEEFDEKPYLKTE